MIIMSPKQSLGDILCLLRFLLHHPDCCRVMYCYSMFLFHYYYSYYVTPNAVGWHIVILRFFFTIITSPQLLSGDVLLFYVSFSLLLFLLRHPERSRVTYCYSTFLFHYYYITPTVVGWCIAILCFFFTIIILITSPQTQSGDVLLFYVSFSLLLLRHPERSQVTYCYSTFLFHYYYYYSSTHFCPLYFSEMPKGQNFMIIIHEILSINYLPFKD
jgi:hypothetical protein